MFFLKTYASFKSILLFIMFSNLSLTLDYFEDYLVIKKIINKFKNFPTCFEIVNFVKKEKLFKLNSNLKRLVLKN